MDTISFLALMLVPCVHAMGNISIREGPRNETILRGGTVELRCVFINKGTAQVMWFRSGGEMISSGDSILPNARPGQSSYQLAGNSRRGQYFLVIPNVQLEDADEYSCGYTKDNGDMDSRSAFLVVQAPPNEGFPMCRVEPESPRVGDFVSFICTSEGGVPNANLAWYRNDVAKTPVTLQISKFRKVLKLDDMTARFVCKADSPVEDSSRRCDLQPVQIVPSVVMNPSELNGVTGEDFYVSCIRVDKSSQTNFMWFYNGDPIENLPDARRFRVLGSGDTLKIARLVERDNGATIKCQLQIYTGFMKHASAAISVQVSDLNNPVLSTTSTSISRNEDVTSYTSHNSKVTYDLLTLSHENENEGEEQTANPALTIIVIITAICFVVIFVLSLVFFKSVRSRKVTENYGNNRERGGQPANGNFRHVYETSIPISPVENEAMLAGNDSQFDRAIYHDQDAGTVDSQGIPVSSPKNQKDAMVPARNNVCDGGCAVPLTEGGTSPSPSSPSADDYLYIVKEKGQYDEFNHKSRVPIHDRLEKKDIQIRPDKKPVLRPVKSEASIVDSLKAESTRPVTKQTSASSLSGEDVTKQRRPPRIDSPKNKRITPNSPPPTHLVPRPNNFMLKQSPNIEYAHEIQREFPSSSDILSNKSPKSVRPMVALKPALKTPPNESKTPGKKSPRAAQKNISSGEGFQDKDGYEVPVDKRARVAHKNKKGSNNSYEYEQIDHVMASRSRDNYTGKKTSQVSPSEYTLLDRRTLESNNYQDLTPPSECSPSLGHPSTSRRSSQHEYETPLFNEPKKRTIDRPVYLEILD